MILDAISLPLVSLHKPFVLAHSPAAPSDATTGPGEPPEGALQDADGYFLVDRFGYYLTTTEP